LYYYLAQASLELKILLSPSAGVTGMGSVPSSTFYLFALFKKHVFANYSFETALEYSTLS
jgi:hypothetical protein